MTGCGQPNWACGGAYRRIRVFTSVRMSRASESQGAGSCAGGVRTSGRHMMVRADRSRTGGRRQLPACHCQARGQVCSDAGESSVQVPGFAGGQPGFRGQSAKPLPSLWWPSRAHGNDDFIPGHISFADTCPDVTIPGGAACGGAVATLKDLATCMQCVAEFESECTDRAQVPQFSAYPPECNLAACDDGEQDGNETDVDCGGSCVPCPSGDGCAVDRDCLSGTCTSGM